MKEKRKRKPWVIALISVGATLGLIVLVLLGYVGYVTFSYYRIGDKDLTINNNQNVAIAQSDIGVKEFSITTYNIGFGAYERDYSFFMDESRFKEEYTASQKQVKTAGKKARGFSKKHVLANTNGAYDTINKLGNLDFMLYQEVDTSSTRSYKVNQVEIGNQKHANYASIFGVNYHSAYLAYPLHEPIGKSNSGITTYSKYEVSNATRKEFKITDSFFGKFFDLDRAFTISEIKIANTVQKLYIFNVHMSAYDENGVVRKVQLAQLKEAIKEARDIDGDNNYVVVGGDFNHDLVIDNPLFNTEYKANIFDLQETEILKTDWFNYFRLNESQDGTEVANLISGELETYAYDFKDINIKAYGPTNIGTCRDASIPFQDKNNNGIIDNAMVSIDGFLVSDNIEVTNIETIGSGENKQVETLDTSDPRYGLGFVYSDHNPVLMNFKLIA
jgi:endonuclease/exonuclease/phosphatase family metal-dependent hydrolase